MRDCNVEEYGSGSQPMGTGCGGGQGKPRAISTMSASVGISGLGLP